MVLDDVTGTASSNTRAGGLGMLAFVRWAFLVAVVGLTGCERLVIPATPPTDAPDAGTASPCYDFEVHESHRYDGHTITTVAPWQDDALVFMTPTIRTGMVAQQVGLSGAETLDLGIVDMFINGSFATSDRIWVGGGKDPIGSVIRAGTPPDTFETIPPRPATMAWVRDVAVHGDTIFALMDSNSLDVFDGQRWVRKRAEAPGPYGPYGRILALGPGEAYYIEYDGGRLMHYSNDEHVEELAQITTELVGIERAFGSLVVGTSDGHLFAKRDGDWTDLGSNTTQMFAFAPLGDAVVFSGPFGTIGQYHDGYGFCEPQPAVGTSVAFLQPIPGGLVVTLEAEATVFVLRIR